jgi:hypothetical protein
MIRINLLPDQAVMPKKPIKWGRFVIAAAIVAAACAGTYLVFFMLPRREPADTNAGKTVLKTVSSTPTVPSAEDTVKDGQKEEEPAETDGLQAQDKLSPSERLLFNRFFPKILVKIFSDRIPDGASFYYIRIDNEGTFIIHGRSRERSLAETYKENLENDSDYIKQVDEIEFRKSKYSGIRYVLKGLVNPELHRTVKDNIARGYKLRKLGDLKSVVNDIEKAGERLGIPVEITPGKSTVEGDTIWQQAVVTFSASYPKTKKFIDIIALRGIRLSYTSIIIKAASGGSVETTASVSLECKE